LLWQYPVAIRLIKIWNLLMKHVAAIVKKILFLLACVIMALGTFTNTRFACARTLNIAASADANITHGTVNSPYPPAAGDDLIANYFDDTSAVLDVPLGAIPINASLNSVQVNFEEHSYSNANGLVSIAGFGRTGAINAADANRGSSMATYSSVALSFGLHSVALNSSGVSLTSSLLGTQSHLGLRFESAATDTNTSFNSVEHSYGIHPSITVSYALPSNPKLVSQFDANITGSTVNQYSPSDYGIIINAFDSTKGVLDYSLAGLPSVTLASASFSFDGTSFSSGNGLVSVYAYSRSGPITSADALASSTLVASFNSTSLGLGNHTISLNSSGLAIIKSLLATNQDLGLLFADGNGHANTGFGSLEEAPGFTAPMLSLNFAPDLNRDGHVNTADVNAMMQALTNTASYAQSVGLSIDELAAIGDVNRDGNFTLTDLQSLLISLKNGNGSESVPEPSSLILLTLGALAFARYFTPAKVATSPKVL
jgi:hypothetical protein